MCQLARLAAVVAVFSTLVEVFLMAWWANQVDLCLLHARGGVSHLIANIMTLLLSSPRSWRCFLHQP